jgi:hypothetical protein
MCFREAPISSVRPLMTAFTARRGTVDPGTKPRRVRRLCPNECQSGDLECRDLLHAGRAECPFCFAAPNLSLQAVAKTIRPGPAALWRSCCQRVVTRPDRWRKRTPGTPGAYAVQPVLITRHQRRLRHRVNHRALPRLGPRVTRRETTDLDTTSVNEVVELPPRP